MNLVLVDVIVLVKSDPQTLGLKIGPNIMSGFSDWAAGDIRLVAQI